MDLTQMHKRVIALGVHQAKITACAAIEHDNELCHDGYGSKSIWQ
jgi:hypothetical protein